MRSLLSSLLPSNVKTTASIVVGTAVGLYAIYKFVNTTPALVQQAVPQALPDEEVQDRIVPQADPIPPELKEMEEVDEKDSKDEALENHLICPITQELMEDPVTTVKGKTYERLAIENWFSRGHNTDPISNEILTDKKLTPNFLAKSLIADYKSKKVSLTPAPARYPEQKILSPHMERVQRIILSDAEAAYRSSATSEILSKLAPYANADGFLGTVRKNYQLPARELLNELKRILPLLPVNTTQEERTEKLKIVMANLLKSDPKTSGDFDKALRLAWNKITDYYPEIATSYPKLPPKKKSNSMSEDYFSRGGLRENIPGFEENFQNYGYR